MNLVFCTNKLSDGGAERVVSLWAKGFVSQGDTVSLILRSSQKRIQYELPVEVKVYYLDIEESGRIATFIRRILRLREILDKISPDYVITALSPWGLWAYLASLGRKRIVINTEHNTFERPETAPMTCSLYFYKYIVNKLFPFITVLTQADKKYIGRRIRHVVVLPNPLVFDIPTVVPKKKNIILAVGRVDAWHVKGFDVLINAWNSIALKYPDWLLQIIGSGSDESFSFLKSLVHPDLLDKNISFLGSKDDLLPYYKSASILVSSSRYEGLGMVIFEAMSQGCACVASDYHGRQVEIIRNESEGIICKADDVNSLADGISRMINDTEYREFVQKQSLQRAHYYTLEKIMSIWNNLLPIKNETSIY